MYPVSEQYKTESEFRLRNPSHIRVVFGLTDPDAPGLSSPVDNGHLSYSVVDSVDLGANAPTTYHTLERNRFVLDGKNPLPVEANPVYQGYVGDGISGDDGYWNVQPKVSITFDDYVQFPALTFAFDESMNEYPSELRIVAYKDGVSVFDETINPDTAYYCYNNHIPVSNKIEIIFVRSVYPHRRARIASLIYGVVNILENGDLASCSSTKEIDLLSSKIPKAEFEFTLIDRNRRYDPENPAGVWEYLESRQPVTYSYGYELSDGSVEWIPWGQSYSDGRFEVTKQGAVSNVSIKCVGLADHLTTMYDEGVYSEEGKSLYDLALEVMRFAGYEKTIELDDALKNIYTHAPVPNRSVRECIQLIANAGMCIMNHSRGGYITIKRESADDVGFVMNFDKMTETPTTAKIPPLRKLTVPYGVISVETQETSAVSDFEIKNAVNKEFVFTHSAMTNHRIATRGVSIVGEPKYYAYKTVVALNGSGTVSIYGNKLITSDMSYTASYGDVGEDLQVNENPLVDNDEYVEEYADWIARCTMRRNTYNAQDRGYPEIDTGDSITFTSNFNNDVPVTVVKQNISFNGAIRGSSAYIIGGGSE